jgi:hypothetical protein
MHNSPFSSILRRCARTVDDDCLPRIGAAQRLRRARAVAIKRVEKLSFSGREDLQLMVNQRVWKMLET